MGVRIILLKRGMRYSIHNGMCIRGKRAGEGIDLHKGNPLSYYNSAKEAVGCNACTNTQ